MSPQPRVIKLKRVVDPNDPNPDNPDSYVDVPCITQISFRDGSGQVFVRTFDSTNNNNGRTTHTHTVKNQVQDGSKNITIDDQNKIDVERIDEAKIQYGDQIEVMKPLSNDPPPLGPTDGPSLGHLKSHVVRYNQENTSDPDSVPWVDVELIDKIKLKGYFKSSVSTRNRVSHSGNTIDAKQQVTFDLSGNTMGDTKDDSDTGMPLNDATDPFNPTFVKIDTTLDMLPMDTNGNPDPVRLDPFQNIVNVSWAPRLIVVLSVGIVHTINTDDEDEYFAYNPPSLSTIPGDPFPDATRDQVAFTWQVFDVTDGKQIDNGVLNAPQGTQTPPYKARTVGQANYSLANGVMTRRKSDGTLAWQVDVTTLNLGQSGDDGQIFFDPFDFQVVAGGIVVICHGAAMISGTMSIVNCYFGLVKLKGKDGSLLWHKYSNPIPDSIGGIGYVADSKYSSNGKKS
jgi:hypothetical protein